MKLSELERKELQEKLEKGKVITENNCWINPRGTIHDRGKLQYKGIRRSYSRWAAVVFFGMEIDCELNVNHRCDNRTCWNPEHIYVGTQAENIHDAAVKGKMDRNSYKTHCKYGHEYNEENTYYWEGERRCRECSRINAPKYKSYYGKY